MKLEILEIYCENCGKPLTVIRDNKNTKTYHCGGCKQELGQKLGYKEIKNE